MTPHVQAIMDRYRKTGSAKAIRMDGQEKGQQHWHRLYERCWCGYLTVPAKYYTYDEKGQTNTQAQAEKAFLASLPANKGSLQTSANKALQTDNCACGRKARPRGTDCWKCYRERSRG